MLFSPGFFVLVCNFLQCMYVIVYVWQITTQLVLFWTKWDDNYTQLNSTETCSNGNICNEITARTHHHYRIRNSSRTCPSWTYNADMHPSKWEGSLENWPLTDLGTSTGDTVLWLVVKWTLNLEAWSGAMQAIVDFRKTREMFWLCQPLLWWDSQEYKQVM